jgi:hypothetical protein
MTAIRKGARLICWKENRAAELESELEAAGFVIESGPFDQSTLKKLAAAPPAAVVIDLGALPSQGRDVAVALRVRAGTRHVPLVFVDGADDAVARVRSLLPDATFVDRASMPAAVRSAIARPVRDPVVPASAMAGYSGTPLLKKLGIKAGSRIVLVKPPENISEILGELPAGVEVRRRPHRQAGVTLWFVRSASDLDRDVERLAEVAGDGRLWICWPKKSSGVASDLTQGRVRERGLAAGIVDFKICAVDDTWSGLCFTKRRRR